MYKRLMVAVVAYNYELSCKAIRMLAENDMDSKIKQVRMGYGQILMEDGTIYKAFPTYNHVRGHCIDQLIIVDDPRWMVYDNQYELLDWIDNRMYMSCVPEEFLVQKYEW